MQFKAGDVVQLKSGGPLMTVTEVGIDTSGTPEVWCTWFAGTEQKHGHFPAETVKAIR